MPGLPKARAPDCPQSASASPTEQEEAVASIEQLQRQLPSLESEVAALTEQRAQAQTGLQAPEGRAEPASGRMIGEADGRHRSGDVARRDLRIVDHEDQGRTAGVGQLHAPSPFIVDFLLAFSISGQHRILPTGMPFAPTSALWLGSQSSLGDGT